MDKQTLSNYGWLVIVTLILAVMLALATPFGTYVGDAVVSVANGFVGTSNEAMDENHISNLENKWDDKLQQKAECGVHKYTDGRDHSPITNCTQGHKFACECGWTVPEGGTYYAGVSTSITNMQNTYTATTIYNEGDRIPCTYKSKQGDIFVLNDLEYRKNMVWDNGWSTSSIRWDCRVIDNTKEYYLPTIGTINNEPVEYMTNTYRNCTNLKEIPKIAENAKYLSNTFDGCTSLTKVNNLPDSVVSLSYTFYNCTEIVEIKKFPQNLTGFWYTFYGCEKLEKVPQFPNKISNMTGAFRGCKLLKSVPSLPNTVTTLNQTFYSSGLEIAPITPNGVTNMDGAFGRCTNIRTYEGSTDADYDFSNYIIPNGVTAIEDFLSTTKITKAPVIPQSVKSMYMAFYRCYDLSGTITVNCNPTKWTMALRDTKITTIAGSTTMQSQLLASKTTDAENPTA